MRPEWIEDVERTARSFPVVPSAVVVQLVKTLDAAIRDRDTEVSENKRIRASLQYTQASLERIIRQLQDCRDTEAAVLRTITEAQDRRAEDYAKGE